MDETSAPDDSSRPDGTDAAAQGAASEPLLASPATDATAKPPLDTGYRVLARKYRPQTFDELIGQEPMVRTLSNAFASGRIAQAWMLTGVRGIGKTTTARILARALNYERPGETERPTIALSAPGSHCQAIMEGRHVDVIEMDAASHTGIGDIREIIESIRYRPVSARYKVYIIDEVHMLSGQAFNGLLKTLEEPPEHVKFIFATTEIRKVPVTVLSRCQRFDLRRIDREVLIAHLARLADLEAVRFDGEALGLIARAAEGSVRDALSLMDQAIAHGGGNASAEDVRMMLGLADRTRIIALFEQVMKGEIAAALGELSEQYQAGADPAVILSDLADYVHLVTRLKVAPDAGISALTETETERGTASAKALSIRVLSRAWQMLLKGISETQTAQKPLAAAEMVLVRLAYAADLPTPDEALKRLRDGDAPARQSASAPPAGASTGLSGAPAGSRGAAVQLTSQSGVHCEPAGPAGALGAARLAAAKSLPHPPAADNAPAPPGPLPASLGDVAVLAGEKRDLRLKNEIEHVVRPVRFEPGLIEITLLPSARRDLAGELGRKLTDWTGQRWTVTIARDGGGMTLAEEKEIEREQRTLDAMADPEVAVVLEAFPGAKIVDVRIHAPHEAPADQQVGSGGATDAALDT